MLYQFFDLIGLNRKMSLLLPPCCPSFLAAMFLPEVERGTTSIVSVYVGSDLEKASKLVNGDGDEDDWSRARVAWV
ncbi:hypothetical protein V6N13_083459 [Hibiscus sabdariffa]